MIILRKKPNLFWVSENLDLDKHDIEPGIPQNFLTQRKMIDGKTKRIQLYDSLSDAISVYSLGGKNLDGMTFGVYQPRYIREEYKLSPSLSDCPYSLVLEGKEYWCQIPLEMIKICDIKIGKKEGEKEFRVSDRTRKQSHMMKQKLGIYKWEEILPEWDKKGKTKKL